MSEAGWKQFHADEAANRMLLGEAIRDLLLHAAKFGADIQPTGDPSMFVLGGVFCHVEIGKDLLEHLPKALNP
jgi:hypothetical protein